MKPDYHQESKTCPHDFYYMKMIKKGLFLVLFCGFLLFFGCSEEETANYMTTTPTTERQISISCNAINCDYKSGSKQITVRTDLPWVAKSTEDWLSVSPSSGTGITTVNVNWKENEIREEREAKVKFSAGDRSASLVLEQGYSEKASHIKSIHPILGNLMNGEMDSVELIFDKSLQVTSYGENSHHYVTDFSAEKFDDGYRWRLPIKWGTAGLRVDMNICYKSYPGASEDKETFSISFCEKKFLLAEEDSGTISHSTLSLDKKSIWISVYSTIQPDANQVMQLSVDDLKVMKTIKMPFAPGRLCMNPYNGMLYVMPSLGYSDSFCVVDPEQGKIVKSIQIEPSPNAHPQYPTIYPDEIAFTKDGFGILRLISPTSSELEWRYIDSADDDKIMLSGYSWDKHIIERLYTNYDYSRIYANMYWHNYSTIDWFNRQNVVPVEIHINGKFNSNEYYAGGKLVCFEMSPFANKAFICSSPACQVVVGLEPISYSNVIIEETRGSVCVWDGLVTDKDYVYKFCSTTNLLELFDMTNSKLIFATKAGSYTLVNSHFLPATDQLIAVNTRGLFILNAAKIKDKIYED